MDIRSFHRWDVTPREAIQIQQQLRARVVARGRLTAPRLIAGTDAAFGPEPGAIVACVVVLSFPELEVVESATVHNKVHFPYVPGLLSFRETPALLEAFERLSCEPDLVMVDGHGMSHQRRAGLACHIGVLLDKPVIGCAKSLLCGTYEDPGPARGSRSDLLDAEGNVIGAVVRTRDRVNPVFVSVGHKLSLAQAVRWTLRCGKGYRIPEPTRQADLLAERAKR